MLQKSKTFSSKPSGINKYPKTRIELHLHLDGAIRVSTIRELAIAKKCSITPNNSEAEIEAATSVDRPTNLAYFLTKLNVYLPLLVGDAVAIERIAYELCQDQAMQHVAYFETRFSPHLLANTVWPHFFLNHPEPRDSSKALTPRDVIQAVARGLHRGEHDFGVMARMILCTIKGQHGWASEVVQLASELAHEGVVGIDIAGDESEYSKEEIEAFHRAKQMSIHRTVHAGEMGPASNVYFAVEKLFAERIGHGYRVLEDKKVYEMCRAKKIHFETCPQSSYLTGAVKPTERHPIITFAEDNINFSINKDDPTVTKSTLDSEYSLLRQMGLNEAHFVKANLNAARSCFLPHQEKLALLARLAKDYGLI